MRPMRVLLVTKTASPEGKLFAGLSISSMAAIATMVAAWLHLLMLTGRARPVRRNLTVTDCPQLNTSDAWNDPDRTTLIPGYEERVRSCNAANASF
jgi:hypothetical protein